METAGAIVKAGQGHIGLNRVERGGLDEPNVAEKQNIISSIQNISVSDNIPRNSLMTENCFCPLWPELPYLCAGEEGVRVLSVEEGEVDGAGGAEVRQVQAVVRKELFREHGLREGESGHHGHIQLQFVPSMVIWVLMTL